MSAARHALPRSPAPRGRRIALFGGTFDPIHTGHLAVARAAEHRFQLDRIYFIPAGRPPHKHGTELAPFAHRFAMVALACAGHPRFVPSLAEAGANGDGRHMFYSVDTVRHFRDRFRQPGDHLYFVLGADSFLHVTTWKDYEKLLGLCDFVVANRPGFRHGMRMDALRKVIPRKLLAPPEETPPDRRAILLRHTAVYLLDTVAMNVSATGVRRRLEHGHSIGGLVPARVEEYINKQGLYR